MLPAIAAGGSALIDMLLGLLAWEAASKGAGMVGRRLVGKGAAELGAAAAEKLGASAAGQMVNKALSPVAGAVGDKVGKYLTAEQIAKGAVVGGAGMGGLLAGTMGMEAANSILATKAGTQYHDVVRATPNAEATQQQQALAGMVQKGQMEQALAQYLGSRELAHQFMADQGRLI